MMNWIFFGMVALSVVFGALSGRMEQVSSAAMTECGGAVQLVLSLVGTMCLWSGLMRVADQAGLTVKISRLLSPLTKIAFRGLGQDSPAMRAISMNMSANLLGLGNAATPLGIAAMKELEKEADYPEAASDHMVMFVVLNTAALDLLPTTTALLRLQAGAAAPFDILPAVWVASVASVIIGVMVAKFLSAAFRPLARRSRTLGGRHGII